MKGVPRRLISALATAARLMVPPVTVLLTTACAQEAPPAPPASIAAETPPRVLQVPAAPTAEPRLISAKEREFRDRLVTRFIPELEKLAADPLLVAAVAEANRTNFETQAEILAKDGLWRQARGADDPLIAPYLTTPVPPSWSRRSGCSPAMPRRS